MKLMQSMALASKIGVLIGAFAASGVGIAATVTTRVHADLYERARAERSVTIWATNAEDVNWIGKSFNVDYPGIEVRVATDLNVAARLITEGRAGRRSADLVWSSEALVQPLIDRGMVARLDWKRLGVKDADVGAEGHMAITSSVTFAVAYNKNRVRPENIPTQWVDLLKPQYRGKMTSSPFLMARLCAALAVYNGEASMADYARKLRLEANILWSNDLSEQLLVSGERDYVVATANHFAYQWVEKGLPLGYSIPEPVFITQFGAVLLKDAPHPRAAELLIAWMLSDNGRKARSEAVFSVDLRPHAKNRRAEELRSSGKVIYLDDVKAMKMRTELIPKFDRILNGLN